jgi:hypothetical protein
MTDTSEILSLPAKPSLEHLRKEAKQRLVVLRGASANAQLTDAQLLVARRYGFSSWRALKLEVESRAAYLTDTRPRPLPLSVVFRPQASANARRFSALQNPTELELSFFPAIAVGAGFVQAITLLATAFAVLH